jgi:hypothetical protein
MAEPGAQLGFSFSVVGQLTAPASARSADSKNSTQRHKIALSIFGHSGISASPESNLLDYRGSDKQKASSSRPTHPLGRWIASPEPGQRRAPVNPCVAITATLPHKRVLC